MTLKHIQSTNKCSDIDQLIVNATISCGIMSKPLCTFWV